MDPTRIENTGTKYIPHDMRGGGLFYGSGIDETTFRLPLTPEDIRTTEGNARRIAEQFIDCLYAAGIVDPEINREKVQRWVVSDNPALASNVAMTAEGAELKYRKRESRGSGLYSLL